ncbi:retrotransposon protein, putative, ty1-copia subclass, partial [Tanacetum coccineum]
EVFETFKVFQKEVENQLGKTIKSLRSDRRGEYMSQEFSDHLKEHWIIAHRTPPYKPQHNGVSERRNRTLLDMYELGDLNEPANYKAALSDPEFDKWLKAINVEMQSMKDNEVWDLVDLPPNGKIIGRKWLFKKKTDMNRAVHTYKACLVAKGFTQTLGIDYEETFSPVADIRAIRILIAIATFYDYEIWQMDVKTAFLNGYLSKEVYMEQPEGFVNPKFPNRTYPHAKKLKLSKSQGASTLAEVKRMPNVPYASAVGSIMYAVRCTRTDVAFAQNITSRFQENVGKLYGN